ncbi:Multiple myeloma tumor-associated protein 2 homolog [Bos taurus] [Lentinula edodes]|uniref:Multiple myeloma tumor-associated protein 2 homolog [Bos taurus] n=1 Tax=Lentinula edodes TaxID=5353 RepID=A0A1Q3EG35_LENED|nr:Multiple myeloma tumor-associated protein 2 homolog [Bos taurus] [Lentinula edodes]
MLCLFLSFPRARSDLSLSLHPSLPLSLHDTHPQNYLGHSINAPTGRWQKNKDVHWYSRDLKDSEAERLEEIRKIKEAEADALAVALGFTPEPRSSSKPDTGTGTMSSLPSSLPPSVSPGDGDKPTPRPEDPKDPQRIIEKEEARAKEKEEKRRRKEEKRARKEERRVRKESRKESRSESKEEAAVGVGVAPVLLVSVVAVPVPVDPIPLATPPAAAPISPQNEDVVNRGRGLDPERRR